MSKAWNLLLWLALFITTWEPASAKPPQVPMPEGLLQRLGCRWDSITRIDYQSANQPSVAQIKMSDDIRYHDFEMMTDGNALYSISLERWSMAEALSPLMGETICTPSRLFLSCTTGSLTMKVERKTLRGIEINAFKLGFEEDRPVVDLGHFTCLLEG